VRSLSSLNVLSELSGTSGGAQSEPETITAIAVSDQAGNGEVVASYSITGDSAVDAVVTTSATRPSAARVLAGQDHTGADASSTFTDNWTTAGSPTTPSIADDLPSDTYYLHVLPENGDDDDVVTSNGFTLETIAPIISAAITSTNGATVTLTVSEAVSGTAAAGDWEVYEDGSPLGVASVASISSTTSIVLTLTTAVSDDTAVITFDYTPGDIADAVSNDLAAITGGSVTNDYTPAEAFAGYGVAYDNGLGTVSPQVFAADHTPLGVSAGDNVIVFYGRSVAATGMTVESSGVGITEIDPTGESGLFGKRISAFEHTIQAGQTGAVSIAVSTDGARNEGGIAVVKTGTLSVADFGRDAQDTDTTLSASVTLSNPGRIIIGYTAAHEQVSGDISVAPPTFGGVPAIDTQLSEQLASGTGDTNETGMAVADIYVPAGTYTVTAVGTGTLVADNGHAMIVLALE